VLFEWALHHHPSLLQDPDLFAGLLRFIHAVLTVAVREERAATTRRLLKTSTS
jgi:hypothetical protein